MPHIFVLIFTGIALYYLYKEKWLRKLFLLSFLIAYLYVFGILNNNVRTASTHGNTIHGWYSKYNKTEKLMATAWVFLFPAASFVAYILIFAIPKPPSIDENTTKQIYATNSFKKTCPRCGNKMLVRVARKGQHKGNKFWGCSSYPKCRQILEYNDASNAATLENRKEENA